jgi:ABC-type branched-subunit amino acid transport system substrate-binding protein/DNA-binding beta-propeller fold protein YncE
MFTSLFFCRQNSLLVACILAVLLGIIAVLTAWPQDPIRGAPTEQRHLIVAAEEGASRVGIYDSTTGHEAASIATGKWPHEIAISPDGKFAYVTCFGLKDYDEHIGKPGATISVIDLKNMAEVRQLYTFRNADEYTKFRAPHGIKVSPDGRRLFVNTEQPTDHMLVYDLTDPGVQFPTKTWEIPKGTHNFLFSADGKDLFLVSGANGISRMDAQTGEISAQYRPKGLVFRGLTYGLEHKVLIASANDQIIMLHPESFRVLKRFDNLKARQILYSAVTPDARYILAPAVWEGELLVIDMHTGQVVRRIIVGADPIHVVVTPDGRTAYASHGRSKYISKIDLQRLEEVRRIPTQGGPNGIAVAPCAVRPARRTLRFGACLPLSGADSPAGNDLRLGYQHWMELTNASGGLVIGGAPYQVEVVYRDTESTQDAARLEALTADLIQKDHVQFLFGGYPSDAHLAVAKKADELKVPLVTASGAAEKIYMQGFRYMFGIMSPARGFLNESVAMTMKLDPPPKTIAFIACKDAASFQDARTTAEFALAKGLRLLTPKAQGLEVAAPGILVFDHNTENFDKYVEALKELNPDLIAQTGHVQEAIPFVEAAHRHGLTPKAFLFSVGPAMPVFVEKLGPRAENMMGAAMWTYSQHSIGHDRFLTPARYTEAFRDRYVREPSYLAAGATTCGFVYEDAFRRANSIDPEAVRTALAKVDMDTFYSHIQVDGRGLNNDRPLITIQLRRNGAEIGHVPLWPPSLAGGNRPVWPFRWAEAAR